MKLSTTWTSHRLGRDVTTVRWGHHGVPVLLFPTAGGDAEECERWHMIDVLTPLLEAGRVKVYSCDSVAGQVWTDGKSRGHHRARVQNQYDAFVVSEVVPAIRADCRTPDIPIIAAGASIGAFNALAAICRHPDLFMSAVCMSGTYDLEPWLKGEMSLDFYYSSPLHFLPNLAQGPELTKLQERFILLATGEGRWEEPAQSWRAANVLGRKGVPNRVDLWGAHYHHDWETWREMLPKYLDELTSL